MIDYESIITELNDEKVKQLLDKLNIPYKDMGNYLILPTYCHHSLNEDASWKLYYYKNTHIFHCYTQCQSQSIFTFLKNFYTSQQQVYDWFTDIYQLVLGCSYFSEESTNRIGYRSIRANYDITKEIHELPAYNNNIIESFIKYYPVEWLNDGITKEAMDKFNIRFAPVENKIIIPHYDVGGRLIGIRGRALNPEEIKMVGKYLPVQIEGKWYSHPLSLNLYGLNITKENIKQSGMVYLFEAEKSVLQMEAFDLLNCSAAVCGSHLNKFALSILIKECHPKEIVLCFDQEEETKQSDKYFNHLYEICNKYKMYCNFSFIYDKQNLLNLKDSPTDKGEEVFRRLLKGRVRV